MPKLNMPPGSLKRSLAKLFQHQVISLFHPDFGNHMTKAGQISDTLSTKYFVRTSSAESHFLYFRHLNLHQLYPHISKPEYMPNTVLLMQLSDSSCLSEGFLAVKY
jgi:hypothetical protein